MTTDWLIRFFPPVTDASGRFSMRLSLHHALYFMLLVLLVCAQSVSNYMMSALEILLAVNWALEWDMRRKFARGNWHPLLVAFLVLALVHLVWLIPSENIAYGLQDLFGKLPLLAIPLIVLTSRPLTRPQLSLAMACFVFTVFVATLIGHVRQATMPQLAYRDIIPFISHIRFALNVCLAMIFLAAFLLVHARRHGRLQAAVAVPVGLLMVYFVHFLLLIHSYTALIILFVVALVMLLAYGRHIENRRWQHLLVTLFLTALVAAVIVVAVCVRDYYKLVPLARQPLATATVNGNPYQHKQNGFVENGNLVENYVCDVELAREWAKRSELPLATVTSNGYAVYPTLLRYLNALGTTKDSVGMQLLTDEDVRAIEQGIANPVYLHGSKLRVMLYVMLYEYESYRVFGAVKNFSVLQRLELWRNTWQVFLHSPLFGCGTGDIGDCCQTELTRRHSPLADHPRNPHNQYLTSLATFGLVGTALIVLAFVWALRRIRWWRRPLLVAYLVVVLISFISENTLSTLAGCVFSTTFFCLLSHPPNPEDFDESAERQT